jgi:hypothetical protein
MLNKAFIVVILCICGTFCCECLGEERAKYSCCAYSMDGRHLILLTDGDGQGHKASIAVFDILRPDYRLRKLTEMQLLNDCSPREWWLCCAGRFFVTFSEGYVHEDQRKLKNFLCIYDLVRKESKRYQLSDLFTEDQIKLLLNRAGRIRDYNLMNHLFGPRLNNDDLQLTMYMAQGNLEIVVDLQSLSAKTQTSVSRPTSLQELHGDPNRKLWLFRASSEPQEGQNAFIPESADTRPKMLRLELEDKTIYYELQPASGEYVFASPENWVEKNSKLARPICVTPIMPLDE